MVVITRSDLTPGYQAQQSCHAIADFQHAFPDASKDWKDTTNSIVLLGARNEQELEKLYDKLSLKTDVVKFYEPDLNNELTSIALYASPEIRKKLANLPLLGKSPKITYRSVIMDMMDTPQTENQSVLEHGMSVYKYWQDLRNHLTTSASLKFEWKLPEWLTENSKFILSTLHNDDTIKEYQLMHDCGKPYCLEYDDEGRKHFPDHANVSADTFSKISDNKIVADLIREDMTLHTIKSEDVPTFVENKPIETILTLLVTSLSELHSNASMFGGIESTSFKIKYKQLDKRGKQIMKILQEQEVAA